MKRSTNFFDVEHGVADFDIKKMGEKVYPTFACNHFIWPAIYIKFQFCPFSISNYQESCNYSISILQFLGFINFLVIRY